MKVNKYILPGLTIFLLLGTVAVAQATGQWAVSGKEMIDVTHMTSSADIRGWMTLQQVAEGFDIEQQTLYQILAIPPEVPPETALKEMETILPEFEVTTVREAVDAYLLEDSESSHETSTEPVVVPTTENNEKIVTTATPSPAEAVETIKITESDHISPADGSSGPTPVPEGEILAAADIKGRHTLQEIVDQAQVPLTDLLAILDLPADIDPSTGLKDLVESGQVPEVQTVRDAVTTLQGK